MGRVRRFKIQTAVDSAGHDGDDFVPYLSTLLTTMPLDVHAVPRCPHNVGTKKRG